MKEVKKINSFSKKKSYNIFTYQTNYSKNKRE